MLKLLGGFTVALLLAQGPGAPALVIRDVNVIDGTGRPPITNATILVRDGVIAAVGPAAEVEIPAGSRVVEGDGRFVMPGLFNLHGHVGVTEGLEVSPDAYTEDGIRRELERYLYFGVVGVRSCGVDADLVFPVRDQSRRAGFRGAHLFTAWRGIAYINGTPTTSLPLGRIPLEVDSETEARRFVRMISDRGADFIKIWVDDGGGTLPKMPEAVYAALLDEARNHGLRVASHTYYQDDLVRLVGYGVSGSIHGIADSTRIREATIDRLASAPFTYVPTLTAYESRFAYADGAPFASDPALAEAFPPAMIEEVRSEDYRRRMGADRNLAGPRLAFDRARRNLRTLHRGGVRIGLGTDHTPTRFPGYMEHRELQLMVEAGLSPMDAIVAGTRNSAVDAGVGETMGTLEVGKHADLIVLEANPLDDIRNTRKIHMVVRDGVVVDRDALRAAFR